MGVFSLVGLIKGLVEARRNNPFGFSGIFNLIGSFVWGDVVIFGILWVLISVVAWSLQDFLLFLLSYGFFWFIRSMGEVSYWLNEQFSSVRRNPPETLWLNKIFPGESVWFGYQIFWQSIAVISGIGSLYLAKLWLWG